MWKVVAQAAHGVGAPAVAGGFAGSVPGQRELQCAKSGRVAVRRWRRRAASAGGGAVRAALRRGGQGGSRPTCCGAESASSPAVCSSEFQKAALLARSSSDCSGCVAAAKARRGSGYAGQPSSPGGQHKADWRPGAAEGSALPQDQILLGTARSGRAAWAARAPAAGVGVFPHGVHLPCFLQQYAGREKKYPPLQITGADNICAAFAGAGHARPARVRQTAFMGRLRLHTRGPCRAVNQGPYAPNVWRSISRRSFRSFSGLAAAPRPLTSSVHSTLVESPPPSSSAVKVPLDLALLEVAAQAPGLFLAGKDDLSLAAVGVLFPAAFRPSSLSS